MTPNKTIVRGMIHAQLLPASVGSGLTDNERRKVRNKLKALRKRHR